MEDDLLGIRGKLPWLGQLDRGPWECTMTLCCILLRQKDLQTLEDFEVGSNIPWKPLLPSEEEHQGWSLGKSYLYL